MRERLASVLAGRPAVALLEGEPGIGKTTLLRDVVSFAAAQGLRVYQATARELEHRRPFGLMAEALQVFDSKGERHLRLAQLLDRDQPAAPLAPADASDVEYRIVEEFVALIEDACAGTAAVISLDDVQWADSSSIRLISRLGRAAPDGLLLLCARRSFPGPKDLDRLFIELESAGASRLRLDPLDDRAVEDLVRRTVDGRPGPSLIAHAGRAGGNPMFVLEIVSALDRNGELKRIGDTVEARGSEGAPSMSLTILHGLSYVPDAVLDVLRVASVLGTSFRVTDLAAMTKRASADLIAILRQGTAAGLLIDDPPNMRFRHDLVRDALYEDLSESLRRSMHRDAAAALGSTGAPHSVIAEHLLRTGPFQDEDVEIVRKAAQEMLAKAPAVAASMLEALLQSASPIYQRDLAPDLAEAYYLSGRVADAIELLRSQGPLLPPRQHQILISALLAAGRKPEALTELAGAEKRWPSPSERAWANATWSVALMETGDAAAAMERAQRAIDEARASQDEATLCTALAQLAAMTSFQGRLSEGLVMAREATALADKTEHKRGHRFHVEMFHAQLAAFADQLEEAAQATVHGRMVAEQLGTRWNIVFYSWTAVDVCFLRGMWDDAIAEYEAGIALAEELGTRNGLQYAHALRGLIAFHRGDLQAADAFTQLAEHEFALAGPQFGTVQMMLMRALLFEQAGESMQALAILGNAWTICRMGFRSELPRLGPHLVRVARIAGDDQTAQSVVDALEELAREADVPIVDAAKWRCAALISGDTASHAEAIDRYRRSPRLHDRATAIAEAARSFAAAGLETEAKELFDEASALLTELDAAHDIALIETDASRFGVRRATKRSGRPRFGWESLTETECRVAALVAEGLSNPRIAEKLFVSRYTVQTHVAHILSKLGFGSRTELAAEVVRRQVSG